MTTEEETKVSGGTEALPFNLADVRRLLEDVRDHALRVRDAAKKSAEQLHGPADPREFHRAGPGQPGIVGVLLNLGNDINAILTDCDDYQRGVELLTGAWDEEPQKPQIVVRDNHMREGDDDAGRRKWEEGLHRLGGEAVSQSLREEILATAPTDQDEGEPNKGDEPGKLTWGHDQVVERVKAALPRASRLKVAR